MILVDVTPSPLNSYSVDLRFPYDPAAIAQLKAMPGCSARRQSGEWVWSAPVDAAVEVLQILREAGVAKCSWAPERNTIKVDQYAPGLRAYQNEGIARLRWLLSTTGGALLADDMGLGKTAQAIFTLRPYGRSVIVCPASVVSHWRDQIQLWDKGRVAFPIRKPKDWTKAPAAGRVSLIMSYQQAANSWKSGRLTPGANAAALDEIHYVKTARVARSKAIVAFTHGVRAQGGVTLGLSGTPLTTRPRDLHNVVEAIYPGRFGWFGAFGKRYCGGKQVTVPGPGGVDKLVWDFNGASRTDELSRRLAHFMVRRTKREVAGELPKLQRICREVELPPDVARDLKRAMALSIDIEAPSRHVGMLLSNVEHHKLEEAIDLAVECLESGGRPLLICHRKASVDALTAALGCPGVTGDTPQDRRVAILTAGTGAAVATVGSIGTGVDGLQHHFDTEIHVGLGYVPGEMLQVESRLDRIGQRMPVTIYYLVGMGSIDELVREVVISRLDTFAQLMGASEAEREFAQSLRGGSEDEILAALYARIDRMK